tara:strand:+ start:223 stop:345 length:123 start_codon:yes stop_codon:yes gene_type:complete
MKRVVFHEFEVFQARCISRLMLSHLSPVDHIAVSIALETN